MYRHTGALSVLTININAITSLPKILALTSYIQYGGYDVILLQEVHAPILSTIPGYDAIYNIDQDHNCGTAILYRETDEVTDVRLLPNGRAIACTIRGLHVVNVYAPSGEGQRRRERAAFYLHEVTPFLMTTKPIVFGGDFNCVTSAADQHPRPSRSVELVDLLAAKDLHDSWRHFHPTHTEFTHHYDTGASRIDRVYVSSQLRNQLSSVAVVPAAFSDHCGYVCELRLPGRVEAPPPRHWKFNTSHLESEGLRLEVQQTWEQCLEKQDNYNSVLQWWADVAKPQLRRAVQRFCREEAYWRRQTLAFYQQCLIDAAQTPVGPDENMRMRLNRIKSKVISLHRERAKGLLVRCRCPSSLEDEDPATYHLARERKRAKSTRVQGIETAAGVYVTERQDLITYIHGYYTDLFQPVDEDPEAVHNILLDLPAPLTNDDRDELVAPLSPLDVKEALKKSPRGKSPGPDGLPSEFYLSFWDMLGGKLTSMVNEVLSGKVIPPRLLQGRIVLIPKVRGRCKAQDLRPITLLNADYKLLARCVAGKIKAVLDTVISPYQACSVTSRNIFHAAAAYRDVVCHAAVTGESASIISIDFANAFDRIGHTYLLQVMDRLGFGWRFLTVIQNILTGATSVVTVNGYPTRPIQIGRSVRQGCPLSMFLFVLAIDPLLRILSNNITGVQVHAASVRCAAYADDVGIFISRATEIDNVRAALRLYERASGAAINPKKTVMVPIGRSGIDTPRPWYRVVEEQKILGLIVTREPQQMQARTWRRVLPLIRGQCEANAPRKLDLLQRVNLINTYILSRAWYVAQLLPIPKMMARAISKATFWLLWRHNIFKVKASTCVLDPSIGGLGLVNFYAKCMALLINRTITLQETYPHGPTAALVEFYRPPSEQAPLSIVGIPYKMFHIREFYLNRSYALRTATAQHHTARLIYDRLTGRPPVHKLEARYPAINWRQVWANISHPLLPSAVRSLWYKLVYNTLHTNQRLADINLVASGNCTQCQVPDTRKHRFECRRVSALWELARGMLGLVNRTTPRNVQVDWFTIPEWKPHLRKRYHATLWLVGHTAYVILELELSDGIEYMNYLWNAHQKIKTHHQYRERFADLLSAALIHGFEKAIGR